MGLIEAINNKVSQGILGAKAIQPYNKTNNGLLSKINRRIDDLVDTVKGIPTFVNDLMHFQTFMHDVNYANKYAKYKQLQNELTGKKYDSTFADYKEGYRLSKHLRANPNASPDIILNPTATNSLVEVKHKPPVDTKKSMAQYAREIYMTPNQYLTHNEE